MTEIYLMISLLGLCMGSFLNVVIYRLPRMLYAQWRNEAIPFNLIYPASHCPSCKKTISPQYNIPLISYCLLKGRCAYCRQTISLRYPLIELLTLGISLFAVYYVGLSWALLFALLFNYSLICLAMIDWEHQILPDTITLPLLWLGLLCSLFPASITHISTLSKDAILGAVIGYLSLWSFAALFKCLRGKEGMGHGDFKLFAAIGAWLGWQLLPFVILLAAFLGSVGGAITLLLHQQDKNTPIPFGPYLAVAGGVAFYWGHTVIDCYLQLISV